MYTHTQDGIHLPKYFLGCSADWRARNSQDSDNQGLHVKVWSRRSHGQEPQLFLSDHTTDVPGKKCVCEFVFIYVYIVLSFSGSILLTAPRNFVRLVQIVPLSFYLLVCILFVSLHSRLFLRAFLEDNRKLCRQKNGSYIWASCRKENDHIYRWYQHAYHQWMGRPGNHFFVRALHLYLVVLIFSSVLISWNRQVTFEFSNIFDVIGDKWNCQTANGTKRVLQSGETRWVHQYRGYSVSGSHDPSWRRSQWYPTET